MKLILGDCVESMRQMPDNSIDSIVTDPPYELGFMGKSWDSSGIANSVKMWSEALRVLKPGGHLLAFSGSRTYHRMAVAIEDAGFEIRDQIMWVYGSGFPKSHNVSKAIDKAAGFDGEVVGTEKVDIGIQSGSMHSGRSTNVVEREIKSLSPQSQQWQGWGTALKPAHEPIVLARKPLIGTVAANVLEHGTGGLNIDGTRVGSEGGTARDGKATMPNDSGWQNMRGHGIAELNAGRFPANFIHDGSEEVVSLFPDKAGAGGKASGATLSGLSTSNSRGAFNGVDDTPFYGDSGSAARFFYSAKASKRDRNEGLEGFEEVVIKGRDANQDQMISPRKLRPTPRANHHPTVKPTDLMRYLCRLITPPNGIVLDPFMGSGSTGKAAVLEGFDFIGCEMSEEYLAIAKARIEFAQNQESGYLL